MSSNKPSEIEDSIDGLHCLINWVHCNKLLIVTDIGHRELSNIYFPKLANRFYLSEPVKMYPDTRLQMIYALKEQFPNHPNFAWQWSFLMPPVGVLTFSWWRWSMTPRWSRGWVASFMSSGWWASRWPCLATICNLGKNMIETKSKPPK